MRSARPDTVWVCAEALAAAGRLQLSGARVAVQGFGAVGRHVALELTRRGARVVAVSDSTGAVYDAGGLDVAALAAFKRARPVSEFPDAKPLERDDLLTVQCELLVPAAQADVIHEGNADHVQARIVLQGANLPVTAGAEAVLAQRGILSVPDVVANAGEVICASVEYGGGSRAQAYAEITERIRANTEELLDRTGGQRHLLPRDLHARFDSSPGPFIDRFRGPRSSAGSWARKSAAARRIQFAHRPSARVGGTFVSTPTLGFASGSIERALKGDQP